MGNMAEEWFIEDGKPRMKGQNNNAQAVSFIAKGLSKEAQQEEQALWMKHGLLSVEAYNEVDPNSKLAFELANPRIEIEKECNCCHCHKPLYMGKVFLTADTDGGLLWLNKAERCEHCTHLSTLYPENPLDGFPPIFICPCKSLAALDIRCTREAIEGPSKDGYRNYEPGDINGTIVCTKCKTKMTYNIESPKGG